MKGFELEGLGGVIGFMASLRLRYSCRGFSTYMHKLAMLLRLGNFTCPTTVGPSSGLASYMNTQRLPPLRVHGLPESSPIPLSEGSEGRGALKDVPLCNGIQSTTWVAWTQVSIT